MIPLKSQNIVHFDYKNWRGEESRRTVIVYHVCWGSTEWHPEEQWLLKAYDTDKQKTRLFALKDISNLKTNEEL